MDDNTHAHKGGQRIAKVIARSGLASRREAEAFIAAGRVAVNGAPVRSPALDVTAHDRITVDGEPLPRRERTRLFLYHKPRGLMTTHSDPQGRPTIFAALPKNLPRLISIGRLDFNTEGLLLLTNDGALARELELPATGWLRRYRVRAHGFLTQDKLDALRGGVTVSGIHYGAIDARIERVQGSNLWLSFAIREGKNREVRNVLDHLGLTVTRLIRVSFGPFRLGELPEGEVEEVRTRVLREQLGERIVEQSGADFSTPLAGPTPAAKSQSLLPAPATHAWRAREEEREPKKLRRKFHGSRSAEQRPTPPRPDEVRAGVLTDRKGRPVAVERFGTPPQPEERPRAPEGKRHGERRGGKPGKFGKPGQKPRSRRSPDRASGPRPHGQRPHGPNRPQRPGGPQRPRGRR